MSTYSLLKTLTPPQPGKAGAINALLFFENGTMLASGGDDQVLRIWDVFSGIAYRSWQDAAWGQITNISLLDELPTQSAVLFVGTAGGIVSILPWLPRIQKFNKQSGSINQIFDAPVESQALDALHCRFAAASAKGQVKLYSIEDRMVLLVFHQDARLKAVHNLSSDRYDLYDPAESLIPLLSVSPTGKTNKIKASSFAENAGRYGESDSAARIFLWGKPTEQKLADEEELAQEQRRMDAQAVNEVREKARLDEEVADTEKTRKEEEEKINDLNAHMEEYRTQAFGALLVSLAFAALIMFRRIWLEKLRMYVGMPVEDVANTAHLDEIYGS
ncbi:hypothetical protein C8R43DRAFT_1132420 [Mycena crocata]|nr:hypothetical protein C8R43DRAFT_1132420 [Mycena crocata]